MSSEIENLRRSYDLLSELERKTSDENERLRALLRRWVAMATEGDNVDEDIMPLVNESRAALGEEGKRARDALREGRLAALREFQKGFEGAEGYSTCEEAYDALQTMIAKEEGGCQP